MGKLFGTNGVRGFANQDMSPELALKLGKALGSFLKEGDTVLVGTDTRTSREMLKQALTAGLLATGVNVADAGVVPTPALQYAVKTAKVYGAGAVITASHNPPEFNGIKFIDPDGTEMASVSEEKIEELFFAERFRLVPWDRLGKVGPVPGVNDAYVQAVVSKVDAEAIRAAGLKVVLDTSNGAGSLTAPFLLRRLGVHVITLNAQPDGTFPGHDSEPTPDNVKDLVRSVTAFGANLGVVQDGDADRCVFVTEKGEYVWGDRILALMAGRVAKEKGGLVVTPVSSSTAVEDYVKQNGGRLEYTRVGAPIVARRMIQTGAVFGGEENGGLIFPEHQHCRDASMSLAKMLEVLAKTKRPLSALLAEVPAYGQHKAKLKCPDAKKQPALAALAQAHARGGKVDTTDGVKIWRDGGWVLVRPSGTEPIFRVYAEGKTPEDAKRLADEALREIEGIIARLP